MEKQSDRASAEGITVSRRVDRAANELVCLCRGLLADGHVSQMGAQFLKDRGTSARLLMSLQETLVCAVSSHFPRDVPLDYS